ncbi:MAG: hypothetical protein AB2L14_27290 [Candidatus Xenobiia bacterium LiM19]
MQTDPSQTRELSPDSITLPQPDAKMAMDILHYNQNLIQLADSKANNLIVINSIFLASVTSLIMAPGAVGQAFPGLKGVLHLAFFFAAVSAIFFCLRIIMTKGDFSEKMRHKDLIFFGDIVHRNLPENYIFEYYRIKPKEFLDDILGRIFATASIADRKFNFTKTAQNITVLSSVLWVMTLFFFLLVR